MWASHGRDGKLKTELTSNAMIFFFDKRQVESEREI